VLLRSGRGRQPGDRLQPGYPNSGGFNPRRTMSARPPDSLRSPDDMLNADQSAPRLARQPPRMIGCGVAIQSARHGRPVVCSDRTRSVEARAACQTIGGESVLRADRRLHHHRDVHELLWLNAMKALVFAGVVQGFSTPPLMFLIMRMTGNRAIMGEAVNDRGISVLGGPQPRPFLPRPAAWSTRGSSDRRG
jgi:hypothetical protein